MTPEQKKLLLNIQAQCVKREYCLTDIDRKIRLMLRKRNQDLSAAPEILSSLVQDGFVDDSRYAAAFCREKASLTGWGPSKIRYALLSKGVSADVVECSLAQIDEQRSLDRLKRLLQTKRKSLGDDPQARLKLLKYALSRGYDYDTVRQFVDARDD